MIELLQNLAGTPLPQIFIIAGIFFLILSVISKLGGKLDIDPKRQGQAIAIGTILIVVGLVIYLLPGEEIPHEQEASNNMEECVLSIYSTPQNEVVHISNEICKIHISKGIPSRDLFEKEKENTKFMIWANNNELNRISEINLIEDEMGGWHLEQFFEFREIKPGQQYKIEGRTMELNNNPVDARIFFVVRE